jgi:hypothetical protein
MGKKSTTLAHWFVYQSSWRPRYWEVSDEEFRRPGGTIGREKRGEGRGKRGLLIGAEFDGHYSRGISGGVTPASSVSRERERNQRR